MFGFFKKKDKDAEPQAAQPTSAPVETTSHPTSFDALIEKGMAHIQNLQAAHSGTWRMEEADSFAVDFETGFISWVFEGEKVVTALATLIGTWSPEDESFLWGWDHPICPPANNDAAKLVKAYADEHNIDSLQSRKFLCLNEDCWPLAGIAVLLGDLQGAYRAPAGNGAYAYIGFSTITISPYNKKAS